MASANFETISIGGTVYTPTSPIELTVANQATLLTWLQSLGVEGTFEIFLTDNSFTIRLLQSSVAIDYFTTSNPTRTYVLNPTNCRLLDTDPAVYCDYQAVSDLAPGDLFRRIIVDLVVYTASPAIDASDAPAVQAWLNSQNLGFITYTVTGQIVALATLTNVNISYMVIDRGGTDVIVGFNETNCHVPVFGCKDWAADNYNPLAEISDNSCVYGTKIYGCKDPAALNYNKDATDSDDSCLYEVARPLDRLRCCAADMGHQIAQADLNGEPVPCCLVKKNAFINDIIFRLENYHADSENTITTFIPGYVASAIIDFNQQTTFGLLSGSVFMSGTVIGTILKGTYADAAAMAVIANTAVNNGGSGWTSVNNNDGTITVSAPSPNQGVNGLTMTVVINPEFDVALAPAISDAYVFGDPIYVNDPDSAFYRKLIYGARLKTSAVATNNSPFLVIQDGATQTFVPLPIYGFPVTIRPDSVCHDAANDTIVITGFSSIVKYTVVDANLNVINGAAPYLGVTTITPSQANTYCYVVYNPTTTSKYFVTELGNLFQVDSAGVMTQLLSGLVGASSIIVNPTTGDLWITGTTDIYVVSSAGTLLATLTPAGGGKPYQSTYYDDGGTPTIAVAVYNTPSYIVTYDASSYAVISASLATMVSDANNTVIYYSTLFNLLFTIDDDDIKVMQTDGTLEQVIDTASLGMTGAIESRYAFVDDLKNNRVFRNFYVDAILDTDTHSYPVEIVYGNDGEETLTATIGNEVPDSYLVTVLRPNDNCWTYEAMMATVDRALQMCAGCCGDSEEDIISDEIPSN